MNTTYDLGSNSATPDRIFRRADGTMSVAWTGSTDMGGGWPDRGSFYTYFDGTNWSTPPTSRIETVRTGWPVNVITSSGKEVIISHNPGTGSYFLVKMERPVAGTGPWTQTNAPAGKGIWPRMAVGGPNGETLHVIKAHYDGAAIDDAYLYYQRSNDGGTTWDTAHMPLPEIGTPWGYKVMGGDAYAIDVVGNTVAILGGNSNNHWTLWKSTDNGDSFTRTIILTHPIPNMDGHQFTDLDMDGTADILQVHDASHEVLIDDNGTVHAFTGYMGIMDQDSSADGWSYFPGWNGLLYWNEGMGTDSLEVLTGALDLDGDSTVQGVGNGAPGYGVSLSSMPTACIDTATGTIYLVYSAAVEYTDYFEDPNDAGSQSFRDLYGMYTSDGGATWSDAANLTRASKIVDGFGNFEGYENVYPSAPRMADGKVHVVWMRDVEPGNALENTPDPITDNEIVYHAFDYSDFDVNLPPTASFSDSTPGYGGKYYFKDLTSNDPHHWIWSFGDGDTAYSKNPFHRYSNETAYTVCLRAVNFDGFDDTCYVINPMNIGVAEFGFNLAFTAYPNPTNNRIALETTGIDLEINEAGVYNMLGERVADIAVQELVNKGRTVIDLANETAGIYFIQVTTNDLTVSKKILLTR
jgi:hypothetical protein